MNTRRRIRFRRLPDGTSAVFGVRSRRPSLLHVAPDHPGALAFAAAVLGLRVTLAVPRHGRSRAKRLFNVRRLREAAVHALRGAPARCIHIAVHALPGAAVPADNAATRLPAASADIVARHLEDAVARHLADLSRRAQRPLAVPDARIDPAPPRIDVPVPAPADLPDRSLRA